MKATMNYLLKVTILESGEVKEFNITETYDYEQKRNFFKVEDFKNEKEYYNLNKVLDEIRCGFNLAYGGKVSFTLYF